MLRTLASRHDSVQLRGLRLYEAEVSSSTGRCSAAMLSYRSINAISAVGQREPFGTTDAGGVGMNQLFQRIAHKGGAIEQFMAAKRRGLIMVPPIGLALVQLLNQLLPARLGDILFRRKFRFLRGFLGRFLGHGMNPYHMSFKVISRSRASTDLLACQDHRNGLRVSIDLTQTIARRLACSRRNGIHFELSFYQVEDPVRDNTRPCVDL